MAAEGIFGLLESSVGIEFGDAGDFNDFWKDLAVPSGVLTPVHTLENPAGSGVLLKLTGLYFTTKICAYFVLDRNGVTVWEGRVGNTVPDSNPRFPGGPIPLDEGQTFTLKIRHQFKIKATGSPAPQEFAGNLFGYKKTL